MYLGGTCKELPTSQRNLFGLKGKRYCTFIIATEISFQINSFLCKSVAINVPGPVPTINFVFPFESLRFFYNFVSTFFKEIGR